MKIKLRCPHCGKELGFFKKLFRKLFHKCSPFSYNYTQASKYALLALSYWSEITTHEKITFYCDNKRKFITLGERPISKPCFYKNKGFDSSESMKNYLTQFHQARCNEGSIHEMAYSLANNLWLNISVSLSNVTNREVEQFFEECFEKFCLEYLSEEGNSAQSS